MSLRLLGTVTLLLAFTACGEEAPQCVDNGNCSEGEACMPDGQCKEVECLYSSECIVGQYCDPTGYTCKPGCLEDGDCLAGESCNVDSRACETDGCRDATLDCSVGEFCDSTTEECYADGDWCGTCNANNINSCGAGAYCVQYDVDTPGYCWNFCEEDTDCPSGFECIDGLGTGYEKICLADCPSLTENGWL